MEPRKKIEQEMFVKHLGTPLPPLDILDIHYRVHKLYYGQYTLQAVYMEMKLTF